jgi:hypothetical protein
MGFIHLEDRAVLEQKYEVYLYPVMSAPLFQANRTPECRVTFSHSTVVFGAGSTESTRTEENVFKNATRISYAIDLKAADVCNRGPSISVDC